MRMNILQNRRRKVVVSCLVALLIAYLGLISYILTHRSEFEEAQEAAIVIAPPTNRPSGSTVSVPRIAPRQRPTTNYQLPTTNSQRPTTNHYSQISNQKSQISNPIHTSSSAQVQHIGGGSNVAQTTNITHTSSSNVVNSPISTSTSAFIVPTLARVSSRNLNAETTRQAEQEVVERNGPERRIANRRNDGWDDYDQDPEPFPDEVPVGAPWILTLMLAAYAYKRNKK